MFYFFFFHSIVVGVIHIINLFALIFNRFFLFVDTCGRRRTIPTVSQWKIDVLEGRSFSHIYHCVKFRFWKLSLERLLFNISNFNYRFPFESSSKFNFWPYRFAFSKIIFLKPNLIRPIGTIHFCVWHKHTLSLSHSSSHEYFSNSFFLMLM